MKLKYIVKDLADVPENLRNLYVKREDGQYIMDVEGAADRTKLDEFRTNNVDLMKKLEKLKDIDPGKYQELLELDRKAKEKQLIEAGKVEDVIRERIQEMKSVHEKELSKLKEQLTVSNRQLEVLLIDNAVKSAAVTSGVLPPAMDDVVLRAKTVFTIHEGRPVMKNEKGEIVYGEDGTTPMGIEAWTKKLKTTAPHLFAGFNGSGATGGQGRMGDMKNMTSVDKIAAGLAAGLAAPAPKGV